MNNFFDKKRNIYILTGLITLLLTAFFVYLMISTAFKPKPVVSVQADNCYKETLHVVTDKNYEPFSFITPDGSYSGMDVELINEISNRLGMNLELELLDWNEAKRQFADGNADAILNMETDLVYADDTMISTIPTVEKQYVVYGREFISSPAELYGRRIVSLHALPELAMDEYITYMDSYSDIFKALARGEYDFAICPVQVGNEYIEDPALKDIRPSYAVSHVYGAIALSPEDTELKSRMDMIIHDLQNEGWLDHLDKKWVSYRYQSMTLKDMLRAHPGVILAFLVSLLLIFFLFIYLMFQHRILLAAEETSRSKTAFLFNMSHDIRTPMNAIIGYTDLAIQSGDDAGTIQEYLKKIKSSGKHLLALINDVLEMSRIESGKMTLEETDTDLVELLDETYDMFTAQMQEKNIDFTVDHTDITHRYVLCDKNRLNRVLLNLLSNAYKFTPEGGTVKVTLSEKNASAEDKASYELRVKDSGIGMTEEFAQKIYEAFERERTSTVSGIQGTGLGMAITKGIIDMMHGTINVNTVQGEGTEFIVTVGLNILDPPEVRSGSSDAPGSSAGSPSVEEEVFDFTGKRVLLVDDIEINIQMAQMFLENVGFTVETATNGREAVDMITRSAPGYYDIVLMDIQMPVMNGYEAAREIRSSDNKAVSDIPMVAMTANAFSEDIKNASDAGFDGHIAKPLDIPKMMQTIKDTIK
ncbi:MAG: transporter substrate-binding domain-containing protein [Lachnospiraceae bacterium]|nr:transporter substrate-binding domain-containing protein [Lachnospiraceae bacterium]